MYTLFTKLETASARLKHTKRIYKQKKEIFESCKAPIEIIVFVNILNKHAIEYISEESAIIFKLTEKIDKYENSMALDLTVGTMQASSKMTFSDGYLVTYWNDRHFGEVNDIKQSIYEDFFWEDHVKFAPKGNLIGFNALEKLKNGDSQMFYDIQSLLENALRDEVCWNRLVNLGIKKSAIIVYHCLHKFENCDDCGFVETHQENVKEKIRFATK